MTSEDNLIICQTIKLFDDVAFSSVNSVPVLYVLRAWAIETQDSLSFFFDGIRMKTAPRGK